MLLSLVIPVYNRPDEMKELLHSLSLQTRRDFELIIVEDGSSLSSEEIVKSYEQVLNIRYFWKENSGPGMTRNYGSDRATGEYLIYLDSDCVIPPQYIETLHKYLENNSVDTFGGPDAASSDFSNFQKAVSYSMTSFFTTGGIRGGKRKLDKFFPRSFNMGYKREVYNRLGGFLPIRHGEDTELSYRLADNNCTSVLIPDAYVYHKRRSTIKSFMRQVFFFGLARVNLYVRYPKTLKLVHILPSLFVLYVLATIALSIVISEYISTLFAMLILIWFMDSAIRNRSIKVGFMSIYTSFIQLFSYGCGMIYGFCMRFILRKTEQDTYNY